MAKKKKTPKKLYDFFHTEVKPGDKVILLDKQRGFRGLDDANLELAIYNKPGQYGFEFTEITIRGNYEVRFREPQLVKLSEMKVAKMSAWQPGLVRKADI